MALVTINQYGQNPAKPYAPYTTTGDIETINSSGMPDRVSAGATTSVLTLESVGQFAQTMLNLNPYFFYRLNELAGPTMLDNTNNGRNGSYSTAGVTYSQTGATGDGDHAVLFDGASGFSHIGSDPTGTGDFSVVFFVKTSSTSSNVTFGTFQGNFGNAQPGFSWAFRTCGGTGNTPAFYIPKDTNFNTTIYAPTANLHDNNFHLVVITRAKATGQLVMYIDGTSVSLANSGNDGQTTAGIAYAGTALNGGADLYLGAASQAGSFVANYWPGTLDEFAFFQRILTAAEVSSLQQQVTGGATLVPQWKKPLVPVALSQKTIGTTQVSVAHGLGYVPTFIGITMTSAGTIWESAAADATNIYLTADAAGRTCIPNVL